MDSLSVTAAEGLSPVEKQVFKTLISHGIKQTSILVAVSGGLDSVALSYVLAKLSPYLKLNVSLAHIHHGNVSDSDKQTTYRNHAWQFVKTLADNLGLSFYSNAQNAQTGAGDTNVGFTLSPPVNLTSEAALREYRYECLRVLANSADADLIGLAHTSDDLLETRLIRLIRGTGIEGLTSMTVVSNGLLRPLLEISRKDLHTFSQESDISWLEDPTNQDLKILRNWLRHHWLVELENFRPGSLAAFGRSLARLVEDQTHGFDPAEFIDADGIDRRRFLELSDEQKGQVVARFMRFMNMKNYGQNHVREVLKRLRSAPTLLKFNLLKHEWTADSSRIWAVGSNEKNS